MESLFCVFSSLGQLYIYPDHMRDGTWSELLAFCPSKRSQGLKVELTTWLRDLSFRSLYQSMHESGSIAAWRVGDRGMCQEREFPQWPATKSLQKRNEPPLPIRWRALATGCGSASLPRTVLQLHRVDSRDEMRHGVLEPQDSASSPSGSNSSEYMAHYHPVGEI